MSHSTNVYHIPAGAPENFARWLRWLAKVDWLTLTGDEQVEQIKLAGIRPAAEDPTFWDAVALITDREMFSDDE